MSLYGSYCRISYWRKKIREYVVNTKLDYKKKTNPNRYDERKRFRKNDLKDSRVEKGMSQEELAVEKTGYTFKKLLVRSR